MLTTTASTLFSSLFFLLSKEFRTLEEKKKILKGARALKNEKKMFFLSCLWVVVLFSERRDCISKTHTKRKSTGGGGNGVRHFRRFWLHRERCAIVIRSYGERRSVGRSVGKTAGTGHNWTWDVYTGRGGKEERKKEKKGPSYYHQAVLDEWLRSFDY